MERLKISGADPQSAINVTFERLKPQAVYTESETFLNPQEAENIYSKRKTYEFLKHGLSPLGGAIAGIGLRLIADTNPNTLQEFAQRPGFFLGATLLGAGAIMAKRALDAVDNYDLAKIKLDKIRNWVNSFKSKEELIFKESLLPMSEEKVLEKPEQLTLDAELAYVKYINKTEALRNIVSKEPVKRIRNATEQNAPTQVAKEKTKISPSERSKRAKAPERKTTKVTNKRSTKTTASKVEQVPQKNTVKKEVISKRTRSFVIDDKRIYLKEFGGIIYHKCSEKTCTVCKEKLIFI